MPQLNKSEAVRQRLRCFLQRIIAFANHEIFDCDPLENKINVRWIALETKTPKLIVKSEIRFLAELAFQTSGPKAKTHLKQDLRTLKDFLGRLEDNRDRTQGSGLWHFTLTLWHQSVEKNLAAFDDTWQRLKGQEAQKNKEKQARSPVLPPFSLPEQRVDRTTDLTAGRSVDSTAGRSVDLTAGRSVGSTDSHVPVALSLGAPSLAEKAVHHNLPARDYGTFVGRSRSLHQLLTFLTLSHPAARISITGIGGVGKTALALESAYCCLLSAQKRSFEGMGEPSVSEPSISEPSMGNSSVPESSVRESSVGASPMGAIVYISMKAQYFTPQGILPKYRYSRTLQDVFRTIAQTLKRSDVLSGDFEQQLDAVYGLLSEQKNLLIIDNLDSLHPENQQAVLSFLYGLPASVKVIVTSRLHLAMDEVLPLFGLDAAEGEAFILHQAQLKAVTLSTAEHKQLYQQTGGIPAAMVYAVGQLSVGYQLPHVLPKLTVRSGDYCRYYLESSVKSIKGQPAYTLMRTLCLFSASAPRAALMFTAQLSEQAAMDGFVALQQRSLVSVQGERYALLPMTYDYITDYVSEGLLDQLKANGRGSQRDFEAAARERQLAWYQQWLVPYCYQNWRDWHDYAAIDLEWDTLRALVDWCVATERYEAFRQLWQALKGYTHLRGYWYERLGWLQWWLAAAKQRKDSPTVIQALHDLGWTLAMMGQPHQLETAKTCFSKVWSSCRTQETTEDRGFQLELAVEQGMLCLFQDELEDVESWLAMAAELLQSMERQGMEAAETLAAEKQRIRLTYYTAQLRYHQGNYAAAKALFRKILERDQTPKNSSLQQQQAEVYSLNWLVDIALEEDELKEADRLLQQSWPIIHRCQDMRSQAFHQRSKAQLERSRGNVVEFRHWSAQAKTCFETLCMQPQAQEMQRWLNSDSMTQQPFVEHMPTQHRPTQQSDSEASALPSQRISQRISQRAGDVFSIKTPQAAARGALPSALSPKY